jgi:hypothetical protein
MANTNLGNGNLRPETFGETRRELARVGVEQSAETNPGAASYGNVVLSCGIGNHVVLRGLPGGAEGIRTSDLRGAGGRSPEGGAAPGSARLNSEGAPPSALVSPLYLPPVRPSDLPRRPRRGDDGCLLRDI